MLPLPQLLQKSKFLIYFNNYNSILSMSTFAEVLVTVSNPNPHATTVQYKY
jgi:hypothetical protein